MVARRNPHKARAAKQRKRFVRKSAGAQRTKVGQSIKKKLGKDAFTIGAPQSLTVTINQEVGRNIGHPVRISQRDKRGRFLKTSRKIEVISRRDQVKHRIKVKLPKLDQKVAASGNVSSSWISYLEWNPTNRTVTMGLLSGWNYVYKMSFKEYEGWYYANSKGTYWHVRLRKKYYHNYINKYWLP